MGTTKKIDIGASRHAGDEDASMAREKDAYQSGVPFPGRVWKKMASSTAVQGS
jgi:hypothetical protein